jgi:hypothetical protein
MAVETTSNSTGGRPDGTLRPRFMIGSTLDALRGTPLHVVLAAQTVFSTVRHASEYLVRQVSWRKAPATKHFLSLTTTSSLHEYCL